jgi:SAM-dependent methyltransferase
MVNRPTEMNIADELLVEVAGYYSAKLAEHGQTPRGVDWNGEQSQSVRFDQLLRIVESDGFSLHDLGCGYGALVDHLGARFNDFSYCGFDISPQMVASARSRFKASPRVRFDVSSRPTESADYGVASGIFNVRLGRSDCEWSALIRDTLDSLDASSRLGFAFNCLTSYSDKDRMRDYLYYADPCAWFDHCKRRYSRNVALLHDYDLYEFTILVKKLR